jgi:hypothetical protein
MPRQTFKSVRAVAVIATIAWAALAGVPPAARAESVYKCRSADGAIAFQDQPCPGGQAESRVEILPPPPPAPSPDYGRAAREDHRVALHARGAPRGGGRDRREPVSYECRAADGEVFYRHGACPKQIAAKDSAAGSRARSGKGAQSFTVSAQPLERSEACRRMASAGSIGRAGRERDETVSTYDRNLGRDPCRYF